MVVKSAMRPRPWIPAFAGMTGVVIGCVKLWSVG